MRQGLIDEYDLIVHPVALGAGLRLFEGLAAPLALAPVGWRPMMTGAAN